MLNYLPIFEIVAMVKSVAMRKVVLGQEVSAQAKEQEADEGDFFVRGN